MKRLKIAVIALFALVTVGNVTAQDENNPWAVGFGANVVDFYLLGSPSFGDQFNDGLGNTDWNIIPVISRITADRYINHGISVQLAASVNRIKHVNRLNDSSDLYYAFDAVAKYDLNELIGKTAWFDPFVYLGGGYTSVDNTGEFMFNGGFGANFWLNKVLGINFQHGTKLGFSDNVRTHYHTSFGLVFRFGGKDSDKDGVFDKDDKCPQTPGLKEFNGCPDADGDGIKDSDDACPNVAGLPTLNGCPDSDGDGVADKDDECPQSAGTKANRGCPDSDGDGVLDKDDRCSTKAGPSANNGCPWPDTDGDGVLDKDDKCPKVAGVASENGCPEPVITKEATDAISFTAKAILFNSGRDTFKPGVSKRLDAIVDVMKKYSRANFSITGHTDSAGAASNNLRLSDRRAKAVKNYLLGHGIDAARITAKGLGEEYPVDTNATRAGRANNRRVEIKVTN